MTLPIKDSRLSILSKLEDLLREDSLYQFAVQHEMPGLEGVTQNFIEDARRIVASGTTGVTQNGFDRKLSDLLEEAEAGYLSVVRDAGPVYVARIKAIALLVNGWPIDQNETVDTNIKDLISASENYEREIQNVFVPEEEEQEKDEVKPETRVSRLPKRGGGNTQRVVLRPAPEPEPEEPEEYEEHEEHEEPKTQQVQKSPGGKYTLYPEEKRPEVAKEITEVIIAELETLVKKASEAEGASTISSELPANMATYCRTIRGLLQEGKIINQPLLNRKRESDVTAEELSGILHDGLIVEVELDGNPRKLTLAQLFEHSKNDVRNILRNENVPAGIKTALGATHRALNLVAQGTRPAYVVTTRELNPKDEDHYNKVLDGIPARGNEEAVEGKNPGLPLSDEIKKSPAIILVAGNLQAIKRELLDDMMSTVSVSMVRTAIASIRHNVPSLEVNSKLIADLEQIETSRSRAQLRSIDNVKGDIFKTLATACKSSEIGRNIVSAVELHITRLLNGGGSIVEERGLLKEINKLGYDAFNYIWKENKTKHNNDKTLEEVNDIINGSPRAYITGKTTEILGLLGIDAHDPDGPKAPNGQPTVSDLTLEGEIITTPKTTTITHKGPGQGGATFVQDVAASPPKEIETGSPG